MFFWKETGPRSFTTFETAFRWTSWELYQNKSRPTRGISGDHINSQALRFWSRKENRETEQKKHRYRIKVKFTSRTQYRIGRALSRSSAVEYYLEKSKDVRSSYLVCATQGSLRLWSGFLTLTCTIGHSFSFPFYDRFASIVQEKFLRSNENRLSRTIDRLNESLNEIYGDGSDKFSCI